GFQAGIRKHQDVETPIVCHILDVTREVEVGVASVEAVVITAKSNILGWFEPVLIAKSKRIAPIVKYMSALVLCNFVLICDTICKLK
ncbi:hypothetical protein Gotur_012633, partial [Gossypium turneri]